SRGSGTVGVRFSKLKLSPTVISESWGFRIQNVVVSPRPPSITLTPGKSGGRPSAAAHIVRARIRNVAPNCRYNRNHCFTPQEWATFKFHTRSSSDERLQLQPQRHAGHSSRCRGEHETGRSVLGSLAKMHADGWLILFHSHWTNFPKRFYRI